jgi:hypothetical protein
MKQYQAKEALNLQSILHSLTRPELELIIRERLDERDDE